MAADRSLLDRIMDFVDRSIGGVITDDPEQRRKRMPNYGSADSGDAGGASGSSDCSDPGGDCGGDGGGD